MNVLGDGLAVPASDRIQETKRDPGDVREPPSDSFQTLRQDFVELATSTPSLSAYRVSFGVNASEPLEGTCSNCNARTKVKKIPEWGGRQDNPLRYCEPCEMRRLDRQNARLEKPLVAHLVHKDNADELLACCCPGVVQNMQWDVALEDNAWVVTDALFDFNRYNTHDMTRDRLNNEMTRIQGIMGQLKSKYERDQKPGVEPATMDRGPGPSPTAVPSATVEEDIVDKLTKLAALKNAGALTSAEFDAAKAKLLG